MLCKEPFSYYWVFLCICSTCLCIYVVFTYSLAQGRHYTWIGPCFSRKLYNLPKWLRNRLLFLVQTYFVPSLVQNFCVYRDKRPSFSYMHQYTIHVFLTYCTLYVEKAMAPHSSTLAWKIPWTEEPGRLQSMVSLRVGHDWVTSLSLFTFMHWRRKWQPTPVFLPGESQGWWSLVGCRLWGPTELDTTEAT